MTVGHYDTILRVLTEKLQDNERTINLQNYQIESLKRKISELEDQAERKINEAL